MRRGVGARLVDGSFVTSKAVPGDFDGCWDHDGVDFDVLDPVLLDFEGHRETQKAKFEGEMFIAATPADALGNRFLDSFNWTGMAGPRASSRSISRTSHDHQRAAVSDHAGAGGEVP